jgi:hypothetical protein
MIRREMQLLSHEVNVERPCPAVATGPQSVKRAVMESLMSLNMTTFRVRLLRRRQLKVYLNHRNFDQAKQTDRLEPKW